MKKLLLAAALMLTSFGAFADEFDDLVKELRDTAPAGCSVRAAKKYRVIFADCKVPDKRLPTDAELASVKTALLNEWRKTPQISAVLKDNDISVFINYVGRDGTIRTIIIAPADI